MGNVQIQEPMGEYAKEGWKDWMWREATVKCLLQNLYVLEDELVADDHAGRRDMVLVSAVADDLEEMMEESFSAQVRDVLPAGGVVTSPHIGRGHRAPLV